MMPSACQFTYINLAFSPAPDDTVSNLYKVCGSMFLRLSRALTFQPVLCHRWPSDSKLQVGLPAFYAQLSHIRLLQHYCRLGLKWTRALHSSFGYDIGHIIAFSYSLCCLTAERDRLGRSGSSFPVIASNNDTYWTSLCQNTRYIIHQSHSAIVLPPSYRCVFHLNRDRPGCGKYCDMISC